MKWRDLGWLLIWDPISGPYWPFPFSIHIFQVEKLRNNLSREIQNVVPIYPRRDFCLSLADSLYLFLLFIHSVFIHSCFIISEAPIFTHVSLKELENCILSWTFQRLNLKSLISLIHTHTYVYKVHIFFSIKLYNLSSCLNCCKEWNLKCVVILTI